MVHSIGNGGEGVGEEQEVSILKVYISPPDFNFL